MASNFANKEVTQLALELMRHSKEVFRNGLDETFENVFVLLTLYINIQFV